MIVENSDGSLKNLQNLVEEEQLKAALNRVDEVISVLEKQILSAQQKRSAILTLLGLGEGPTRLPDIPAALISNRMPSRVIRTFAKDYIEIHGPKTASEIGKAMNESPLKLGPIRPDVKVWYALKDDPQFMRKEDGTYMVRVFGDTR